MTATEELRRLLDERGVEHYDGTERTLWGYEQTGEDAGIYRFAASEISGGFLQFDMFRITPEQAVEATLGRGECRMDGYTDAAFRVVAAPNETDYVDYAEVCECSACGADVIIPHDYERVTAGDDRLWPTYNYCPSCGRRVKA